MNGLSHLDTTYFSAILERMGVAEMGRKSDRLTGCVTLGTRVTTAVNHDDGTVPPRNEQLSISREYWSEWSKPLGYNIFFLQSWKGWVLQKWGESLTD